MKPFQVRILQSAARELARLDKTAAHRIAERMSRLAENMDEIRPEPLAGNLASLYKLRVGDYRVIYEVIHDEHNILIHMVGHRRDIYRNSRRSGL